MRIYPAPDLGRRPVPDSSRPVRKLGFLTIGLFDPAHPAAGHESTLQVIELGERLGFDSAWLRHRHLQFGISSPIAMMAAASQRTSRIELGTAVTPLGWENPLRLAEDLATVDLLSSGRINPAVSVGEPMHYDSLKHELYPNSAAQEDFGYARVERLARLIAGEPVREFFASRALGRSSPTAWSLTPPGFGTDFGMEQAASALPCGPAPTGSTCSPAVSSSRRLMRTPWLPRSSSLKFAPSARLPRRRRPVPTLALAPGMGTRPASRKDSW